MTLNPALQGKTYPEVLFHVDGERVRAFADAVGHPSDDVPPTFVTLAEHEVGMPSVVADEELGLDYARVVHGEQEYRWHRPMRVGETLRVATTIGSIRSRGGMGFLALRTDLRDEDGELVAVATSVLIVRGER